MFLSLGSTRLAVYEGMGDCSAIYRRHTLSEQPFYSCNCSKDQRRIVGEKIKQSSPRLRLISEKMHFSGVKETRKNRTDRLGRRQWNFQYLCVINELRCLRNQSQSNMLHAAVCFLFSFARCRSHSFTFRRMSRDAFFFSFR